MKRPLPPGLMSTFRIAVLLKLLGVLMGIMLSYWLIRDWALDRWWMGLVTAVTLLVWLLPWPRWFKCSSLAAEHRQLIPALTFGIIAPHLDLWRSSQVPMDRLLNNPLFAEGLNWSSQQLNNIHALGQLFFIVPVMLASWHYGKKGMISSLVLAGVLYVSMPFWLPENGLEWFVYGVRGFVLLGVTLILAFTTHTLASQQRASNRALEHANQQLREQATAMEQLATSRERNRLARELHDTLAHSLSGTAVSLQATATLLKHNPAAAADELTVAQDRIRAGVKDARRAIASLRASPLEERGLEGALRQRVEQISQRSGLQTTCDIQPLPTLSLAVEQAIYRIADEALVNAEKHAQAKTLSLALSATDNQVTLIVQDDGVGFEVESETGNGRFGLIGMKERAELIQAILTINSTPTAGTSITLQTL